MMKLSYRTFVLILFLGAMFASCKSKEIVSYPGALKKHHVQTNVEWNKEFPTLRDSSYMLWKKNLIPLFNKDLNFEDSLKLVKTLFIQQYKIYTEDLRKDGFSQSILNYLKPCQDSAVLLIFPENKKNTSILKLYRSAEYNNRWKSGSYHGFYVTLEQIEEVQKDKNNTLFFLDMVTKSNYREGFLVYINKKGQLMHIRFIKPDWLFENIFKGNIKYF